MHDIVIRGGTILDRTGADAFTGDISIDGGKLTQVGGKAGTAKARNRCEWSTRRPRLGGCPGRLVRAGR